MTFYSIILFLHVTAVLGLFASLSFELLALSRLRQASDLGEVRRWIDPVPGIPLAAIASIFIVLLSGMCEWPPLTWPGRRQRSWRWC
jgi:hypothetical protein